MTEAREAVSDQVCLFCNGQRRRLLGAPKLPELPEGWQWFALNAGAFDQVDSKGAQRLVTSDGFGGFYALGPGPWPLEILFPNLLKDEAGFRRPGRFFGTIEVGEPAAMLSWIGPELIRSKQSISVASLNSLLASRVRPMIEDFLADYSYCQLVDNQMVPRTGWQNLWNEWSAGKGWQVQLEDAIDFSDSNADAYSAQQQEVAGLQRQEELIKVRRELEFKRLRADTQFQEDCEAIQHQQGIQQKQREFELERLQAEHGLNLLQLNLEKRRTEIELEKLSGRDSSPDHELADALAAALGAHFQEIKDGIHKVLKSSSAPGMTSGGSTEGDELAGPLFQLPYWSLRGGLMNEHRSDLLEVVSSHLQVPGQRVEIVKNDMTKVRSAYLGWNTRSIETRKQVDVVKNLLPINTPLQFTLTSPLKGCVTVINLGTKGEVRLHVPNRYRLPEECQIEASLNYMVPGKTLLPGTQLLRNGLEYLEVGPPGWEHLLVLVTAEPLIPTELVEQRSQPDDPLALLTEHEVQELIHILREMSPGLWSAGILSFEVQSV